MQSNLDAILASLSPCGTEVINRERVQVYRHPRGGLVVLMEDDVNGGNQLVSVEAAKAFKNGAYPINPELRDLVAAEVLDGAQPFSLRARDTQVEHSRRLLDGLMSRLHAFGSGTKFMAEAN